jgi:hypothetical protein
MRRAARIDLNQPEIVRALRSAGAVVTSMAPLGGGVSDLLVSFRQRWLVMECKADDGELTEDQKIWIGAQRAPVYIVHSPSEAVRLLDAVTPDWLLGLAASAEKRVHVCQGPQGEEELIAPEQPCLREKLRDRVHHALKASWRAHTKLSENELCEMLGASKASKRVEKALRALVREGLAKREGNNRNAMYWAEGST